MIFQKPKRAVDRVFLHCSASDNPAHDNIETIRRWHVVDNGWADVGYHFFIRKSGLIEAGRPLELTPAAQNGHNTGTIAICCSGLAADKFTAAQFEALRDLCSQINLAYKATGVTFHGHREVSPKSCPVYDYRTVLGLDARGNLGAAGFAPPSTDADTPLDTSRTLRRGASGDDVRWMQTLLRRALSAPALSADGDFGAVTEKALKTFQGAHNLFVDGIYGPLTREVLSDLFHALPE